MKLIEVVVINQSIQLLWGSGVAQRLGNGLPCDDPGFRFLVGTL